MFIAALFRIVQNQKELKYPSIREWIDEVLCIHTMDFKALKRKTTDMCENMVETQKTNKQKKPDTKYYILYASLSKIWQQ